ncbi:MAG: hypothetical protein OQK44_06490, partial [Gammaproteobacteria bacterium]|nr:hypothetical protein [Gammaproteobacteria bacterium]
RAAKVAAGPLATLLYLFISNVSHHASRKLSINRYEPAVISGLSGRRAIIYIILDNTNML